jgi:hypothetical protein
MRKRKGWFGVHHGTTVFPVRRRRRVCRGDVCRHAGAGSHADLAEADDDNEVDDLADVDDGREVVDDPDEGSCSLIVGQRRRRSKRPGRHRERRTSLPR